MVTQDPPLHDLPAEQILLGSILTDPAVFDLATDLGITAATFYRPAHATLYRAIAASIDAGIPVEPAALAARLAETGDLARVGGAPYLHTLIAAVPTVANASHYARRLLEVAQWRQLGHIEARFAQLVATGPTLDRKVDDVVEQVNRALEELATGPGTDDPLSWADVIPAGMASMEPEADEVTSRVPTGFIDLDRLLGGGLGAGHQVILAARTSMGKSVLGRGFLRAAAFRHKIPAVLFTLEMTAAEVFRAVLSAETRIPLNIIEAGTMDDADWTRVARYVADTADVPFFIDDTPGLTLSQIRAKCRRLRKRHGLGLVVVDYLQLVVPEGRQESRQVAVAEISRGLKLLAQQLECPVVTIAQLNRSPDQRADKHPQMSDLRESGSIEQDANVVILIYRDDYYDTESPRAGEADLIVAKHRGGPTDTITVAAQLHLSRFADMAVT